MTLPGRCMGCGTAVTWDKKAWRSANRTGQLHPHHCPPSRALCGAFMPNARERCARRPGHSGGDHRTRWSMDNALEAHTGRRKVA